MGTYDTRGGSAISPEDQDESCDRCGLDPNDCKCQIEEANVLTDEQRASAMAALEAWQSDLETDVPSWEWVFLAGLRMGAEQEREACAGTVRKYLLYDSQRAVSWHEVQDTLEAIRSRQLPGEGKETT